MVITKHVLSPIHVMSQGELSITDNTSPTTITTADTFTLFDATTSLTSGAINFDSPSAGRLRYIGRDTILFHCGCTLSISSAGANDIVQAVLYKNGTVNANKEFTGGTQMSVGVIEKKLVNASDVKSTAIHTFISLSKNDYIELGVSNVTDSDDLTVKHMNLFAMAMDIC